MCFLLLLLDDEDMSILLLKLERHSYHVVIMRHHVSWSLFISRGTRTDATIYLDPGRPRINRLNMDKFKVAINDAVHYNDIIVFSRT